MMYYSYLWHDSFTCATWLIHMCDVTHSYVWHHSSTCVTWHIHMRGMNVVKEERRFLFAVVCGCVYRAVALQLHATTGTKKKNQPSRCLLYMCGMHRCEMTNSYVWHVSFICITALHNMRDMSRMADSYASYKIYVYTYVYICMYMSVRIYMYAYMYIHIYVYIYVYAYLYSRTHVYKCVYTYAYIYTS